MQVGEIIKESLAELGVKHVFGIPGTHIYHVFKAIEDTGGIKAIINRHEMASVFMAEAYARVSGITGVAIVTAGPGLTNALTGLGQAFTTSSPVLLISGDVPIGNRYDFHGVDEPNILTWTSYPISKSSHIIETPDEAEEYIKKAYMSASKGRKGPIHISIPRDILKETTQYRGTTSEDGLSYSLTSFDKVIRNYIIGKIAVILGDEAWYQETLDNLMEFIENSETPFLSSMVSLGAIPQSNTYFTGYYEKSFAVFPSAKKIVEEADTLIMIGVRPDSVDSVALRKYALNAKKIIHILPSTIVRGGIDQILNENTLVTESYKENGRDIINVYTTNYQIMELLKDVGIHSDKFEIDYKQEIAEFQEKLSQELEEHSSRKPIHMGYALYILREYIRDGSIVTTDVGGNESWARDIIGLYKDVRYLYASGFGSLGYSFPAALGAKIAVPAKDVISITGDGSILMSLMELNTMSFYSIAAKIFVLNDSNYGILGYLSKRDFDKEIETYIGSVSFARVAEAMGVEAIHVDDPNELEGAIKDAINSNKPILVDIITSKADIPPLWR